MEGRGISNTEKIEAKNNPYIAKFEAFFESEYKKEIERLVEEYPEKKSLNVDVKKLELFDFYLVDDLIENPDYIILAAEQAMKSIEVPTIEKKEFKPKIRFYNLPRDRDINIREISSEHLGRLITIEGVVRQITDVLPKLEIADWQCKRCGADYKIIQDTNEIKKPHVCTSCNGKDFELLVDGSKFQDYQKIQIQETLEKLVGNEQPSYIDVYVGDDLVNKISAGDKTKFTGILRLNPTKEKKVVYGRYLEVNYLEETEREFESLEVSVEEEKKIKELSKDEKIYEKLVASIAPAIYGHEIIKEAIALQLFGGVKKTTLANQAIRGNIHILLVGDPGVAKSVLLTATHQIAPKSIYIAGKTASGVGLTASAVKDEFGEGGWTLKAGALVLSSGGLCLTDELDKMDAEDRSALHEAMEQGMISIAKAGIVTRFKSDTSILAAANPKYSRFDQYQPFIEQINLPASLMSRFDLYFMIRDTLDKVKDEKVSEHILRSHQIGQMLSQYKKKGKKIPEENREDVEKTKPPIETDLLKKYISYARQNVFPILTQEALQQIKDFYVGLRDSGRESQTYTATFRQLEGIIRLAEASARVRLSDSVEEEDSQRAIKLVRACLGDLLTDPETGKIDIDMVTTGQTHSKVDKLKAILQIIREKMSEGIDMVPIEEIIEVANEKGIDEEKTKEIISELEKKGEIYKPRIHYVKPTKKG